MMERTQSVSEYLELYKLLNKYNKVNNESLYAKYPHLVGSEGIDTIISRKRTNKYGTFVPYWENSISVD